MEIFLTGGTGFIGSYVTERLLRNGHCLTILARNPQKVKGFVDHPQIRFIHGKLSDHEKIEASMSGCEACIHIALGWGETAREMLLEDTLNSVFLFECAARNGVAYFIYTSSTAAIGEFIPRMDENVKTMPSDYYGATKAASENYLMAVSVKTGMRSIIIRPGYTFGNPVVSGAPMQPDSRFRVMIKKALNDETIRVVENDGTQFIWAGDLASLYESALESSYNRQIYFGLGREFVTWEEIAKKVIETTCSSSKIITEDYGYRETPYLFDLRKIERDFGFSFTCREKIIEHIRYIQTLFTSSINA